METALFDYHLPADRIAQHPAESRDGSRLLVVNRKDRSIAHRRFQELPDYIGAKDRVFRNNAKVLPARLFAQRNTGGRVECLLLRPAPRPGSYPEEWWCLLKPGRKLPIGSRFSANGLFVAEVIDKNDSAEYRVSFDLVSHSSVVQLVESMGKMPLPPYISRDREDDRDRHDKERYQTIYAQDEHAVAAAAPTAGLHFTQNLIETLESQGACFHDLTLHVGMGTFKPLGEGEVEAHEIHREIYEVPPTTQEALVTTPRDGKRRVCIGTTSVRTIEDFMRKREEPSDKTYTDEAALFLYPPCSFKGVDALITNFHLPKSTLLCLVSAFLSPNKSDGIDWLKSIYEEAISEEYRFLSYGDAMLIL